MSRPSVARGRPSPGESAARVRIEPWNERWRRASIRFLEHQGWSSLAHELAKGADTHVPTILALDGGQVIGMLEGTLCQIYDPKWAPRDIDRPQGWIFHLVVAADRRRRHVGTSLVARLADQAVESGVTYIALMAAGGEGLEDRSAFFESVGMRHVWNAPIVYAGRVGDITAASATVTGTGKT